MTENEYKKYLNYRKKQIREGYNQDKMDRLCSSIENQHFDTLEDLGRAIEKCGGYIQEADEYSEVVFFEFDGEDLTIPYRFNPDDTIESKKVRHQ